MSRGLGHADLDVGSVFIRISVAEGALPRVHCRGCTAEVTACFESVAATIEEAVTGLLTRRADLFDGSSSGGGGSGGAGSGGGGSGGAGPDVCGAGIDVVIVGGLGALPPAHAAVMRAAGRAQAEREYALRASRSVRFPGNDLPGNDS